MKVAVNLILIDRDIRRRAALSHALAASAIHVEPFESIAEMSRAWPRSGVVLILDEGEAISNLIDLMTAHGEWFPIMAFSEEPATARVVEAVFEGAIGYLGWPIDSDELPAAIEHAMKRAEGMGNMKLREVTARARVSKLTRREKEVLGGVARGLSNRLIGERLSISPRTVEIHRANMLTKLGAAHTSEAIRIAIEADLG